MSKVNSANPEPDKPALPVCGLVMPISGFQSYSSSHWSEVRDILERSIVSAGFQPRAVWESTDADIIHARIVQNLYSDEVVVVDASGLNPNVMFELGMRLTFRKPTVIVADDATKLPFDTSSIEHKIYPVDLHFSRIESFMNSLSEKIKSFLDPEKRANYKPYLDTFGDFTVVQPEPKSIQFDDFVVNKLNELSSQISAVRRDQTNVRNFIARNSEIPSNGLRFIPSDEVQKESDYVSDLLWNDKNIRLLHELWSQGMTASQIAGYLGDGFTKNMVIGKAYRLGLEKRPEPTY